MLSTGFSTTVDSVDESCGYPVDGVDNFARTHTFPAFFACQAVDNPVDTVDEYALWLCIKNVYENE